MLKRQEIEPFQLAGVFCRQFRKFRFGGLQGQVYVPDFSNELRGIGEGVDQCKLVGTIQQRLLFVLAMDVEKGRSQFAQRRNGARLIVDVNPIPFIRRDLSPDNDLVAFGIESEAIEAGIDVCFKNGLDDGACLTGPDHFGRGFRAGQQSQGVDDNGLSGSGFAGKQVETGIEVKFELVDEGKISDAKKPQHTRGL